MNFPGKGLRSWQLALALLLLPAVPVAGQGLVEVPRPVPGTVEESVYDQLVAVHDAVEQRTAAGDPESQARLYGDLGQLYAAYELWDAARASLANARSLEPERFRWSYLLGYVETRRGDLEAATDDFTQAVALKPGDLAAWLRLGELYLDRDDAAAARHGFEEALGIDPAAAAAHYGLARALVLAGETEAAVGHFEKALELDPAASRVHYPLAQAYRRLGRQDEARAQLDQSGEAAPGFPDPLVGEIVEKAGGAAFHAFRGDNAVLRQDYEAAAAAYRKAVEAAPKNFYYRKSLGLTLHQLGDLDGAREQLIEAIDLDPGEDRRKVEKTNLHYTIGSMALNQGVLYAAWEHYHAALAYDPEHVNTYFQVGNLLLRQQRLGDALTYFDKAVEIDPQRADIRLQRATVQMDFGLFREALPELRRQLAADPGNERLQWLVGEAEKRAREEGEKKDEGKEKAGTETPEPPSDR